MPDLNDNERSELEQQLQEYHRAVESEFNVKSSQANLEGDISALEQSTRDFFRRHVNLAAANIVNLAASSTSDAVRLQASKYILEQSFESTAPVNPLADILEGLRYSKNSR